MAEIIRLFVAEADRKGRTECDELVFDSGGVLGDKFHGKNPDRSVLITGRPAYELAAEHGIELEEGDLGENILLDLDPRKLEEGCIVRIGEVELEMSRRCPICEHLAIYDERLPRLVKELRGVYLSVRKGGRIDRSSPVEIIDKRATGE
jgi:MOSC domain-containing protein YiiM